MCIMCNKALWIEHLLPQCIILTTLCDMLHCLHVALYACDAGRKCSLHMQKNADIWLHAS